jgi:hypothetical protein
MPPASWMRSPVEPIAWLPERYPSATEGGGVALAIPDLASGRRKAGRRDRQASV